MSHARNFDRMRSRRHWLQQALQGLAALSAWPLAAQVRAARSDPLRLLCSGPAGSVPDLIARTIGEPLAVLLAQPVVVDNRPGAAGQISVAALKAAPAEPPTLLLAQGAIATVDPCLYPRLGYEPAVDLQPVSLPGEMSLALAIGPAVPAEVATLADFLAWLRSHPGQANIGSPGTGTLPHLLACLLTSETGGAWQHVAYSGGPPAVTALLGGQIAALVLPEGLVRQHHASGRLRVIGTSGPVRSGTLPAVPTFVEQGLPGLVVKEWFAFFAPAALPAPAMQALGASLREAIARPEVANAFTVAGMTPASSTPAALVARIAAEQRYWQPLIRTQGIKAE